MLKDEIEKAKRTVNTDSVQITVGEIATMYSAKELNILPDFQRLFRWSDESKSSFVESILVGIPIPPIFVYENADGTWELIDGLQRVSTVLEFMGLLSDPDSEELRRSKLMATKYLPSLKGVTWQSQSADEESLDKSLQLFFRRHRIDVQILKHPSDPKTKFDLFQRLNRGGAYANAQEVRSCSMVLANPGFTQRLRRFATQESFIRVFHVTDDQKEKQTDLEYVVRLGVHLFEDYVKGWDVEEFLDAAVLRVMERQESEVVDKMQWVVDTLDRLLGEKALIPPSSAGAPRFSLRALEAIAVGIGRNQAAILGKADSDAFILERINSFWEQPQVGDMSATGLRGTVRIQRTVSFGSRWFDPNA